MFLIDSLPVDLSVGNAGPQHSRDLGLVGSWPLNEGHGEDAYDLSAFRNHGTWNGSSTTRYGPGPHDGSRAGWFDETNSDDVLVSPFTKITGYPFTLQVWFKFLDESTTDTVYWEVLNFNSDQSTRDETRLFVRPFSSTVLRIGYWVYWATTGANDSYYGTTAYSRAGWHLLSMVFRTATDRELYIDGISDYQSSGACSFASALGSDGIITLGAYYRRGARYGSANWNGWLADASAYDRALTAGEIRDIYLNGRDLYQRPTIPVMTSGAAPSVRTATVAATTGGVSPNATATFTPPTYSGSAACSIGGTQASASGTTTEPTFTASAAPAAGGVEVSATATFTAPVYTATVSADVGGVSPAVSATFTVPAYTASVAIVSGGVEAAVSATFTAPIYSATVGVTIGGISADATALFAAEVFSATASPITGGVESAASATFTAPVYAASAAITVGATISDSTATFTAPIYTASAVIEIGAATGQASALFATVIRSATISAEVGGVTADATATFVAPEGTSLPIIVQQTLMLGV